MNLVNPEPRIESSAEKKLIGRRMIMSFGNNTTAELWKSFMPRRFEIKNNIGTDLYSMQIYPFSFFDTFDLKKEFEKWATIEVNDFDNVPNEMESFILRSGLYAVFLYKGRPSEAGPTFQYILRTWLPNSEYELDSRPHFEILGEKYENEGDNSEEEIWIPIKLKS